MCKRVDFLVHHNPDDRSEHLRVGYAFDVVSEMQMACWYKSYCPGECPIDKLAITRGLRDDDSVNSLSS